MGKIINYRISPSVAIYGYIDPTHVTVSPAQTVPAQGFTLGWYVRGSPIYGAGSSNLVKDCINFRNFTTAGKIYTSSVLVNNSTMAGNFAFMSGFGMSLEIASGGDAPMTNNALLSNYMFMETPMLGYTTKSNRTFKVIGNTIIGGAINPEEMISNLVVSNNTVFLGPSYINMYNSVRTFGNEGGTYWTNCVNLYWDHNAYYSSIPGANADLVFCFQGEGGTNGGYGALATLAQWQQYCGFDSNSTYATGWPTNYLDVAVRQLDWDTNCFHVGVVSMSGQTNVPLTLSNYGFNSGDTYELRDAQNYFTVLNSGIYTNGSINLPLNLTNVAAIPGVWHFTNQHSNVQYPGMFNVFVLRRKSTSAATGRTAFHLEPD